MKIRSFSKYAWIIGLLALSAGMVIGGISCGSDNSTNNTSTAGAYDGVWTAQWSYTISIWYSGTAYCHNCNYSGSTTLSVGGALGSGNYQAQGHENMTCNDCATSVDYNFGGYIDPSGVINGKFYYWGNTMNESFAGKCSSSSCSASGSDSFTITMTKQ